MNTISPNIADFEQQLSVDSFLKDFSKTEDTVFSENFSIFDKMS
jgi:hypothetical protein